MPELSGKEREDRARFRRTLTRVLLAQAVALALLWILQARYAT
jgi:hypothetical protein